MKVCVNLSIGEGEEKAAVIVTYPDGDTRTLDAEHGCVWVDLNEFANVQIAPVVEAPPQE